MDDIEHATPFHVLALIHLYFFSQMIDRHDASHSMLGLAIKTCQLLEMDDHQGRIVWKSSLGSPLGTEGSGIGANFLNSMWALLYSWDWFGHFFHQRMTLLRNELKPTFIESITVPDHGEAANPNEK